MWNQDKNFSKLESFNWNLLIFKSLKEKRKLNRINLFVFVFKILKICLVSIDSCFLIVE
jgi:hypothetical protein